MDHSEKPNVEAVREDLRTQHMTQYQETLKHLDDKPSLTRSVPSAIVMCLAAFLSYVLTLIPLAAIHTLIQHGLEGFRRPDSTLSPYATGTLIIVTILVIALGLTIGTVIIYAFESKSHFGREGLVRWSILGVITAVLTTLRNSPRILDLVLAAAIPIAAYHLAFRVLRLPRLAGDRKKDTTS